jgi:hypothetical protein
MGKPSPVAQFADFAVIWDEDHDERVIEPIEHIYRSGLLPSFMFFGERKGSFTAILSDPVRNQQRRSFLKEKIEAITQSLDDPWPADVTDTNSDEAHIINDDRAKVALYLANLKMLWQLGTKTTGPSKDNHMPQVLFSPE